MKNYHIGNYVRISKRTARKLFDAGKIVFFCPVNLRPDSSWNLSARVGGNEYRNFDLCVNAFEYYNCYNNLTGRYTAFYIVEG